jgi:hypothetical protein
MRTQFSARPSETNIYALFMVREATFTHRLHPFIILSSEMIERTDIQARVFCTASQSAKLRRACRLVGLAS